DLRITVSPADIGPSQALVETTWSGRQELASYDATRQSLLDTLAAHPEQVVPGSVQVFDMEVVRDTKDTAFKFSLGAATALFGGLIVGGFMIGAGLAAVGGEETVIAGPGGNGGGGPAAPDPYTIEALDGPFRFSTGRLVAPPDTEVTFTLVNNGQAKHNISFYTSDPAAGGELIHQGTIIDGGGTTSAETFTTPGVGEYFFHCDLHPDTMKGVFAVEEGAPPPGGGGGGADGGGAAEGTVVTANNMKFDTNRIEATAGEEFTLTFENKDSVMHNISFYTDSSASEILAPGAEGEIIRSDESATMTFTPPAPGTYFFHCDLHPDMKGDFVVN
ncbi:MAG: cupredoxin domain-containing protein, partial [Dehalococcoidia bacterium]|nr:cupredoxin domain-containing protein [Dehalococcoidia bacterium]